MEEKKYYITTPIYYPSGTFHVGHCYCTVVADTIARYKRLRGYDVFFMTGTDEHGQKIEKKAKEANKSPKEYVDEIVADTKNLWEKLGITYDKYIRTTDEEHIKCVQNIVQKLYDNGDIYKSTYEGKYCTPCEAFFTESQLVNGKCPDCRRDVELVKEESYFFKLSKYQKRLLEFYKKNEEFLEPIPRKNELINNFFKKGLTDICISRTSIDWGIKIPFDTKHTVYVWIDALSNYISGLGYLTQDESKFSKFWPADLHLVGKEIFRFHAMIWPALLMALSLPLPKKIYGHGWLMVNGEKISKSKGNYKDPREYINETSVDTLRYFLLREVVLGQDGNFSEEIFIERANSNLSNDFGNLVSRSTAMVEKYNKGILEKGTEEDFHDIALIESASDLMGKVEKLMDSLKVNEALSEIFNTIAKSNKYIDLTLPWILAKEGKQDRLNRVLYNLIETIRIISICLKPFMIEVPQKIFEQLGLNEEETSWDNGKIFGIIKSGKIIKKGENLFPRVELKKENVKMDEDQNKEKGYITIDELDKVKLKVGKIIKVERIENADKLYKLLVDLGEEQPRIIVSGLVKYYTEEELLSKKIIVVSNLKPVKLRGVLSEGMLLAAGDGDIVKLLTIDDSDSLESGTNIH